MSGFLDNRIEKGNIVEGYECLGNFDDAKFYKNKNYKFITGLGSAISFKKKDKAIKSYGLNENDFIKLISKSSIIETSSTNLKAGCLIFDNVFLGFSVKIGYLSLINTKVFIGHETKIADYCFVGPNSTVSGNVNVESSVYIGAGVTIKDHVSICSNVLIGCGSVVVKDIKIPGTYAGVPAKLIKI